MTCNNLQPASAVSRLALPSTGSPSEVNTYLPFGIYSDPGSDFYSVEFLSGAADQVAYTYNKLGGQMLDIELKTANIYSCYEDAVMEYSYLMNIHQAKNALSDMLGNATASFDQDGTIRNGESLSGSNINLKYPRFEFAYARRVANGIGAEISLNGTDSEYSASIDVVVGQQDYDLQSAISQSSALTSSLDYYGKVGNTRVLIKKVFYKTVHAMWRFYGYYGGINVVGNMNNYGQFSDATTFEIVPVWQNKLQAMAYEDAIYTRRSHFSYELKNNKLRILPVPTRNYPSKIWVNFSIPGDATRDEDADDGLDGVNNVGTLPFENLRYPNINAIGKHWIRRFALACAKGVLAQVRGKFETIPIPGDSATLNAAQLAQESADEKESLREELKTILDELTYTELMKTNAEMTDAVQSIQQKIPRLIYVG